MGLGLAVLILSSPFIPQGQSIAAEPSNAESSPLETADQNNLPHSATHFTFCNKQRLFSRPNGMTSAGPYYTCLVKMNNVKDFPYDYALYFSTDHDQRAGGIWLYVCKGDPTDPGAWQSYDEAVAGGAFEYLKTKPASNPIYLDTTQGTQTETPHAVVIEGKVYMTYHNVGAGHNQSTLLATSPDGVNFTRINGQEDSVIIDYDPKTAPGNGHTGYFRWGPNPFAGVPYKYIGYSLHGGGDISHSAMWASQDALKWIKLAVLDHIEGHAIEKGRFIEWLELDPNSITALGNGEYVAICVGGSRASGNAARRNELYEIFLTDDGRTLTRMSRKILPNGPAGADDEEEVGNATTAVIGDTWRLIYVGTSKKGSVNTVMAATGKLNLGAEKSTPLKLSERQRHFLPFQGTVPLAPHHTFEAEDLTQVAQEDNGWQRVHEPEGFSGTGAMRALVKKKNAYLSTELELERAGMYWIWVRGHGPDGRSDSIHVALDDGEPTMVSVPQGDWVWGVAAFAWTEAGKHQLRCTVRESGFVFDKIVITADAAFRPQ